MGFVPGATTQIEAFLTQLGAQELMNSGVGGIKYFAVSDEAANYATAEKLTNYQVFTLVGKLPIEDKYLTVLNDTVLASRVFVDNTTETLKSFESGNINVLLEETIGSPNTTNTFAIYSYEVDRTNTSSYQLNWLKDLTLPYGPTDTALWSATFANNGYSDTAIADMNTNTPLFFVIDSSQHAYVDGKTIKVTIPYLSGTTDLYGTYLNTNRSASYYDGFINETSNYLSRFGPNVVLLFSDDVQRPNGDATKSWSTGYDYANAPFSQGGKSLANFVASPGLNKDTAVGIAYLDKGVVVIFNSYLYNGYINKTNNNLSITNKNVVKRTVANFVCDLPIGKFYRSQNATFATNTPVRISSIGLYNSSKQLVAVGRLSSEIEKSAGQRFTFLVKLVI
jgi:hypothetical protein